MEVKPFYKEGFFQFHFRAMICYNLIATRDGGMLCFTSRDLG